MKKKEEEEEENMQAASIKQTCETFFPSRELRTCNTNVTVLH